MHSSFNMPVNMPSFLFPGMRAIYQQLFGIYRDSNPLVISTINKIWQFPSSNEPLDYIFIYANAGSPAEEVPEHWHYISLGLSDLYGDSRVHVIDPSISAERVSGLGFELTFRLKRHDEVTPPSWPAQLLQQLAKYVFMSRNKFYPGEISYFGFSLFISNIAYQPFKVTIFRGKNHSMAMKTLRSDTY